MTLELGFGCILAADADVDVEVEVEVDFDVALDAPTVDTSQSAIADRLLLLFLL